MEALTVALTLDIMRRLEAQDGNMVTVAAHIGGDVPVDGEQSAFITGGGEWMPIGISPVVAPIAGPHPLLETKDEFFRRAQTAWDDAVVEIAEQGLSVIVPRKVELHCDWLVRYNVRFETVAAIVEGTDIDESTVYKAVRSAAHVIGLTIRRDLN
jgi:hypothetical protein